MQRFVFVPSVGVGRMQQDELRQLAQAGRPDRLLLFAGVDCGAAPASTIRISQASSSG
jgi:hypothetical protein